MHTCVDTGVLLNKGLKVVTCKWFQLWSLACVWGIAACMVQAGAMLYLPFSRISPSSDLFP
jgi:hypothetical protein